MGDPQQPAKSRRNFPITIYTCAKCKRPLRYSYWGDSLVCGCGYVYALMLGEVSFETLDEREGDFIELAKREQKPEAMAALGVETVGTVLSALTSDTEGEGGA